MKENLRKRLPYFIGIVLYGIAYFITTDIVDTDFFYDPPQYSYKDWFNENDFIEFSEDSTGVIDYKNLVGDFKYEIKDWDIILKGTSNLNQDSPEYKKGF